VLSVAAAHLRNVGQNIRKFGKDKALHALLASTFRKVAFDPPLASHFDLTLE
jgi:hypothetical protein